MGVFRFQVPATDFATEDSSLRRAYVTGQDRTPSRVVVELRDGLLTIQRPSPESGRVHVPWPVAGHGRPVLATATLAERPEPYHLGLELARGRLNDVRNQASDWSQAGMRLPPDFEQRLRDSQRAFARAATTRGDPDEAAVAARACLEATCGAAAVLSEAYTEQVLQRRLEHTAKLPTLLACALEGDPRHAPWAATLADGLNGARVSCNWASIAPDEAAHRWEISDAQIHWCRKRGLTVTAGPLLDLRPGALPDWLWLWEGDFDEIVGQAADLVRQTLTRYRGRVAAWHLLARVASGDVLGLSEEDQIRLAARCLQVARQVDPSAHLVIDFDRPWAEWMASSPFQLGPLHLADSLARADLGLSGIGLEIAPGFGGPGSLMRDLFEFSRLLDLYALVNLPVHVSLVFPSSARHDAGTSESTQVDVAQWPDPVDETSQREWAARWIALAVAKPYVRSVTWLQATDAAPHLFAHGGLFRADGTPKPVLDWIKPFRAGLLT